MPAKRARITPGRRTKGRKAPTLPKLKAQAWKLLSELVRRRNADDEGLVHCYTCSMILPWKQMQAGHAIPGRTGAVLFDEEIIRPQDAYCNIWQRGNYQVFIPKLIMEHTPNDGITDGMKWWEAKLQASRQVKKWDRQDLEGKIADYRARLVALE